jgi:hypothetical protein
VLEPEEKNNLIVRLLPGAGHRTVGRRGHGGTGRGSGARHRNLRCKPALGSRRYILGTGIS